ncbi:DNA-protecting protein DprA [Xenorhabdus sp. ZM]|uniref:DNA-processing protein DprA n=1 Tax=Xenorhabdus szentirmaii TaxID=290112 RepID=UPI0019A2F99B|nr:DNA-processing protein DprA [Xenorhabdus sp. ZM]MBD2806694.1 DNA-protecting protein DprA [Xenorhabdus sp. ZM]
MEKNPDYWKAETVAFLALQSIRGVGFKTLYKISAQKISFRELMQIEDVEHFEKMLRQKLDDSIKASHESWMQFKLNLWNEGLELARRYLKKNIRVFFYDQDLFPPQLRNIPEPPMWLFIEGNYLILHQPSVAIVGSRKSTEDGLWLTKYIVAAMANQGLASVSGLADGIDQKVHTESIRFNVPTIAVLGTGIDRNYPSGSEHLRAQIVANGGAIVTEYLIDQSYNAHNFIRRNRIQASLSQVTVPVEWRINSGTAHTVNFTKDYGRFLVMLYLYQTDLENAEIKAVKEYRFGRIFSIPEQSGELIEFLKQPEKSESLIPQVEQGQISMDL